MAADGQFSSISPAIRRQWDAETFYDAAWTEAEARVEDWWSLEQLATLPAGFQAVMLWARVNGEVLNGGFTQLFFNGGVEATAELRTYIKRAGLDAATKILDRALDVERARHTASGVRPGDMESGQYRKSEAGVAIEQCSAEWYQIEGACFQWLMKYLQSHPRLFNEG